MHNWSCADICDHEGDKVEYCTEFPFKHFTKVSRFFGPVETVACFEDNSRVKEILACPGEGKVLVVDGRGSHRRALLGDLIATSASKNGWAGVVLNGVVRDSVALQSMDQLGVCALGTNPRKSDRKGAGTVGEQVTFAGLEFKRGAYVYVDEDGIIVSPHLIEGI
jgi:regulator of ribonuclease activity A